MNILLVLVRAVHFGSCSVLQSVFAVLFLAARPACKRAGGNVSSAIGRYDRQLRWLLVICLLGALASGFFWIWLAIAGMSGSSLSDSFQLELFKMVLTQTQPGRVWMLRMGFWSVFALSLCFLPSALAEGKTRFLPGSLCAFAAVLLNASIAWLGHAGASEGPEATLQLGADVTHLVTAGVWPAGLVPLALFLRCFLQARNPALLGAACVVTRRFSALSLGAVGLLTASGFANGYMLTGTVRALVATDYGRILLLKVALFTATIAIGAWNFRLKARFDPAPGAMPNDDARGAALSRIARNVLIELALVAVILLVTGLLGITPPANHS